MTWCPVPPETSGALASESKKVAAAAAAVILVDIQNAVPESSTLVGDQGLVLEILMQNED